MFIITLCALFVFSLAKGLYTVNFGNQHNLQISYISYLAD